MSATNKRSTVVEETSGCDCKKYREHARSAEEKRALEARCNRIVGQLNGVKKMIGEDRYCEDLLIQLSAIEASVRGLSNIIFEEHMQCCMAEKIRRGEDEVLYEVCELFERLRRW